MTRIQTLYTAITLPCLVAVLVACTAALFPVFNNDVYGHMAAGRQIAETGSVPDHDTFSFFRGEPQPWRNHNWLSGLFFYMVYQKTGVDGLLAIKLIIVALIAVFITLASASKGPAAAWTCVALGALWMPFIRVRLTVRPHLFGLLFVALLALGLSRLVAASTRRAATLWISGLAAAQIAWTNLHGSGPLGIVMTGIAVACWFGQPRVRARLSLLLVAQLLASCVSPYGPLILIETFKHIGDDTMRQALSEWQSFGDKDSLGFTAALCLTGVLLAAAAPRLFRGSSQDRVSLITCLLFLVMGIRSSRFIVHTLWLSIPYLAPPLSSQLAKLPPLHRRIFASVSAVALLFFTPLMSQRLFPDLGFGFGSSTRLIPEGSGAFINRHIPRARLFGTIEDAWYVSFAAPNARVLIDGRIALYGLSILQEVNKAAQRPESFGRLMDKYGVNTALVKRAHNNHRHAVTWLREQPQWHLVYIEDKHALFTKLEVRPTLNHLPVTPAIERLSKPEAVKQELSLLRKDRSARGYVAYIDALLKLDPWLRSGGYDGLSSPEEAGETSASQKLAMKQALKLLRRATERLSHMPSVSALHALVALQVCHLDEAETAIDRASREGKNRHALLGAIELAIRRGETEKARVALTAAKRDPRSVSDRWQAALWRSIDLPSSRCQPND